MNSNKNQQLRQQGALARRENDIKKYAKLLRDKNISEHDKQKWKSKLAIARSDVKALKNKIKKIL
jgi:hypothetical protein